MARAAVFIVLCAFAFVVSQVDTRLIILNEEELVNTCTGTCDSLPTLYNTKDCRTLSGCRLSSYGWNLDFVRCDFCACNCEVDTTYRDYIDERTRLSTNEDEMYGTCTGVCKKSGLVRTNIKGCQEIRDCDFAAYGWARGFVRCNYCTCWCENRRYSSTYRMRNMKYDLTEMKIKAGQLTSLSETILENGSDTPQTVTRIITYTHSQTTELSTSHSMGYGLTVTVEATVGIPLVAGVTASVSNQLTYGFQHTNGQSNTTTKGDQVQASIVVPPRSSMKATIFGHRLQVNIPFSCELVTRYDDGSTRSKPITGVYSNVDTGRFTVKYGAAQPMKLELKRRSLRVSKPRQAMTALLSPTGIKY